MRRGVEQGESQRAARRRAQRASGEREIGEIHRGMQGLYEQRTKAIERELTVLTQAKEANGGTPVRYTQLAFREEPYAHHSLSTHRRLHQKFMQARTTGRFDREHLERDVEKLDTYGRSVSGLSIAEIEEMDIDSQTGYLQQDDRRRISKMFRGKAVLPPLALLKRFRHSPEDQIVLDDVTVFAIQGWARPETLDAEPQLRKLHRNLSAYFDYYVDLSIDPKLDTEEALKLRSAISLNGVYFGAALAGYLPARLGITPASATKIYNERLLEEGSVLSKIWEANRKVHFDPQTRNAYFEGALPEDLTPYQFYDTDMDRQATHILREHYSEALASDEEQFAAHKIADEAKEDLTSSFPAVMKSIFRNPEKRLEVSMEEGHAISDVTVTAANKRTLMFILHMQDDTHLTLEMNRDHQLFGIPPELLRAQPNVDDMILADILPRLLSRFETRKPEPQPRGTVFRYQTAQTATELSSNGQAEVVEAPRKRKGRRRTHGEEPDLPTPERAPEKVRFVSHTEEQVKGLLGARATDRDVRIAMDKIRLFEYGALGNKHLGWGLKGFVSLPFQGRRLILEAKEVDGKTMYTPHSVKEREELDTAGRGYKPLIRRRKTKK